MKKKKESVRKSGGNQVSFKLLFLVVMITVILSLAVSYAVVSLSKPGADYSADSGKIIVQIQPDISSGKIVVEIIGDENEQKEVSDGS